MPNDEGGLCPLQQPIQLPVGQHGARTGSAVVVGYTDFVRRRGQRVLEVVEDRTVWPIADRRHRRDAFVGQSDSYVHDSRLRLRDRPVHVFRA